MDTEVTVDVDTFDRGDRHVATGLLELKTLIPFCIEDRAYLVRRAPVVCFSPHRSLDKKNIQVNSNFAIIMMISQTGDTNCMYGVMSSSVHFSRSVKSWLKRSTVPSGRSSTRSREMVSGLEARSTRATPFTRQHKTFENYSEKHE